MMKRLQYIGPTALRYTLVARLLHWAIALLILINIPLGLLREAMLDAYPATMQIHKSLGVTILFLAFLRVMWRFTHRPPALPTSMEPLSKSAANHVHLTLYTLMLSIPLAGWIATSAGKYPLSWFWLIDLPKFAVMKGSWTAIAAKFSHEWLSYALIALIALHLLAAMRHHFILKDQVLRRMIG